ncbi:hypothetical protein DXG03_004645 [Asterophora parasitica]|uniref:glutathione synthase n=1 Tax=Asterophora parasitica TaxID=117018 RepID=A0A9P7K8X4_9AGAR|nr:hypothetical protein DXG03_004645 [Asterophora parasitica]
MAPASVLSEWPPKLTEAQVHELTLLATSYAFSTGLLYLPPAKQQPPIPESAIHAPLALFPSPLPRRLFEQAQRIQHIYNILYARIALDEEFLDRIMGAENGVGKVDDFIGQLWTGWRQLRDEGLVQPLHLGLFRSDYLLHAPPDQAPTLKQVEFNTISVSFGALSERTAGLHRYLQAATQYYNSSPHIRPENFPANDTVAGLVEGLAAAHKASRILFVVQPGERNVFDQRPLEYKLLERHSIHIIRQTFDELAHSASLDPETRVLRISVSPDLHPDGFFEISTVYFRAGYAPSEYLTPVHYQTRFLLERSRAINCPTIALQLAGGKKVQEVLTQPGVLEHFLSDEARWGKATFGPQELDELRQSFMGMWGLDVGKDLLTPDHDALESGKEGFGVSRARELALSLVLKPQREGGGNNVYKDSIPSFLDTLPPKERQSWIVMELIVPPNGTGNYLIRAGGANQAALKVDVVSELGIFGWALFGGKDEDITEKGAGWLVRTKGKDSDEGGVATGFSVLDSVLLQELPPSPMYLSSDRQGSNAGIGFELVRLLAEKGHTVYLASRNEASGHKAQAQLQADGLHVKFVQLDVTDITSVVAAKDTIEKAEGRLDVLVNNAGIGLLDKEQNATLVSLDVIREAFEPNFYGVIQTTITFLPLLRASPQAVILNVSSDMASNNLQSKSSHLHVVAYNTSKAAANSYTIALAHELRSEGIKVNAITPGFTSTKLNGFRKGGKSIKAGAEILLPWALLDKDGPTGVWQASPGEVGNAVQTALKAGYRHIDGAWRYGNEAEVGEGLRLSNVPRSELWNTFHAPEDIEPSLEESLSHLGTDYIDLYLIHWPVAQYEDGTLNEPLTVDPYPTWKKLEELVEKGKIRNIGVSNFNVRRLKNLTANPLKIRPAINQVELSYWNPQPELLEWSKAHNVLLEAYSPLGSTSRVKDSLNVPVVSKIRHSLPARGLNICTSRSRKLLLSSESPPRKFYSPGRSSVE